APGTFGRDALAVGRGRTRRRRSAPRRAAFAVSRRDTGDNLHQLPADAARYAGRVAGHRLRSRPRHVDRLRGVNRPAAEVVSRKSLPIGRRALDGVSARANEAIPAVGVRPRLARFSRSVWIGVGAEAARAVQSLGGQRRLASGAPLAGAPSHRWGGAAGPSSAGEHPGRVTRAPEALWSGQRRTAAV